MSRNVACILFSLPMGEESAAFLERLQSVCHQLHAGFLLLGLLCGVCHQPHTRFLLLGLLCAHRIPEHAGMLGRKAAAVLAAAAAGAPHLPLCSILLPCAQQDNSPPGTFHIPHSRLVSSVIHLCLCTGQHLPCEWVWLHPESPQLPGKSTQGVRQGKILQPLCSSTCEWPLKGVGHCLPWQTLRDGVQPLPALRCTPVPGRVSLTDPGFPLFILPVINLLFSTGNPHPAVFNTKIPKIYFSFPSPSFSQRD